MPRERHLTLTDVGFAVKDRHYSYTDVDRIYFRYVETYIKRTNLYVGNNHSVTVGLYGPGTGEEVLITSAGGEKAARSLIEKLSGIQRHTFSRRLEKYEEPLRKSGYFYYDGKKITVDGDVHHPDLDWRTGRRKKTATVINLKSSVFRLPFRIYQEAERGGFSGLLWGGKKRYYIETTIDADVFLFLLERHFNLRFPSRTRTTPFNEGLAAVPAGSEQTVAQSSTSGNSRVDITKYVKRLIKWGLIGGLVLDGGMLLQALLSNNPQWLAMMTARPEAPYGIAIILVGVPLGLVLLLVVLGLLSALLIGLPPETKA